eukprot:g8876.t1
MVPYDGLSPPSPVPTFIEESARYQDTLIEAIQAQELADVREILTAIPDHLRKATLLQPSVKMENKLQTPLMAGAATGNISIVGAILASFEKLFVEDEDEHRRQNERGRRKEMKRQMEVVDVDDRTLVMLASCSGSSAMFNVISQEVQRKQFRKVLTQQDANGMTFLHHAINAKSDDQTDFGAPQGQPRSPLESALDQWSADPMLVIETPGAEEPTTPVSDAELLDPWVPVVKSAFKFARASLWLAEYRRQLLVRDAWGRSTIEHAINSGRPQVVEVVFDAIRRDIYDEEMDRLLDPGILTNHGESPMEAALKSEGGRKVMRLIAEKAKSLKASGFEYVAGSDVSLRAQDSTVANKIQSFVPGNLIVIFQLLLPETGVDGTGPLSLLAVLCFIAPLWSWGASMGMGKSPKLQNTRARGTTAKHLLASPAMFFWGISTSNIGQVSFNMSETVSAAALAVATIIIPALDSFFSGGGARQTFSTVFIAMLDFWDKLGKKPPSKIARARHLDWDDDDKHGGKRRSTSTVSHWGTAGLELSEASFQRTSLETLPGLRNATEERRKSTPAALRALTELSPSENLQSVPSPRSAISEAFHRGRTAAAEALGSLGFRPETEDSKTEAVEALQALDPRPAISKAFDGGKAAAAEALQSVDLRPEIEDSKSEGEEELQALDPRPAICKAFDGGKTAAAEALGSLGFRPEIEDSKTEAVEALQALDPRPAISKAFDGGKAAAAEALRSVDLRQGIEDGRTEAEDALQAVDARPAISKAFDGGKTAAAETLRSVDLRHGIEDGKAEAEAALRALDPRPAISKAFKAGRAAAAETFGSVDLRHGIEDGKTEAEEALQALDPRPAISKAFDGGKTVAAEVLGSVDLRQGIEDGKTEAGEALPALDPRPVLREAFDEGQTGARGHLEALAAPVAGEVKKSIDATPTSRDVSEEGEERTVEAVGSIAVSLASPDMDHRTT